MSVVADIIALAQQRQAAMTKDVTPATQALPQDNSGEDDKLLIDIEVIEG